MNIKPFVLLDFMDYRLSRQIDELPHWQKLQHLSFVQQFRQLTPKEQTWLMKATK